MFGGEGLDLSRSDVVRGGFPFLANGRKGLVGLVDLLNDGCGKTTGIFSGVGHINIRATAGVGGGDSHGSLNISESSTRIWSARESIRQKQKYELSGSITFPDYTRNDASGGILGIQRVTQLLSNGVILLFHRESLENERVPFVLKRLQQSRDRRMARGAWRSGTGVFIQRLVPVWM